MSPKLTPFSKVSSFLRANVEDLKTNEADNKFSVKVRRGIW